MSKHPLFSDEEYDEIVAFRELVTKHVKAGTTDQIYDDPLGRQFGSRAGEGNWERVRFVWTDRLKRIEELKSINKYLYLKNPLARRAYYNWRDDSIVIKFRRSKKRLVIPCELLKNLAGLSQKQKNRVKVKNGGETINWVDLNIYYPVKALVEGRCGASNWTKVLREKGIINNIKII